MPSITLGQTSFCPPTPSQVWLSSPSFNWLPLARGSMQKTFGHFPQNYQNFYPRERFGRIQLQLNQTLMVFPFFQCQLTNHDGVAFNFLSFQLIFLTLKHFMCEVFLIIYRHIINFDIHSPIKSLFKVQFSHWLQRIN